MAIAYAFYPIQGRSQTFSLGRPLEGPVLQQGELSMVCVGLTERDLLQWHDATRKIFGGALGGAGQNFGGAVAPPGTPLAPPLIPYHNLLHTHRHRGHSRFEKNKI